MKKGFTLIELLAVIVIMSILLGIGVPVLINSLTNKKVQARDEIYTIIEKSARSYAADFVSSYPAIVNLDDICDEYFECPVTDPVTNEEMSGIIYIDYTGESTYIDLDDDECVVIFDPSGGEVNPNYKIIELNSEIGVLPTATSNNSNLTFKEWQTNDGDSINSTSMFTNKYNIVYASYIDSVYTVNFDANGGSDLSFASKTLKYGDAYGSLPTVTYQGHSFIGWYTKEIGGTKITETTLYSFTKDRVVYARWDADKFTVTLNANGGTISPSDTWKYNTSTTLVKDISYSTTYGVMPVPVRNGYTFKGWYTDNLNYTTEVTSDTIVNPTNHSLYAKWEINSYIVTFEAGEGTVTPLKKNVDYDTACGDLPTPVRTGYHFDGWYSQSTGGVLITSDTIITQNLTVYARYTINNYVVTFVTEGTVSPSSKTITYKNNYGDLPIPVRSGYTFIGWYLEDTYKNQILNTSVMTTASNHNLYAKWDNTKYIVTFDSDGGNSISNKEVIFNSAYGELETPSKTGYTFEGWFTEKTGGNKIESVTTVTTAENHTLYAHWNINSYTLTFNPVGGTVTPTSKSLNYNGSYGELPTPSKSGYTFIGWYTKENGGSSVNSSNTIGSSDVTIYAHYNANSYTLNFDSNGGDVSIYSKTVTYDSAYGELPTPTKSGSTFAGWKSNITNEIKVSTDTYKVVGDETLTAVWN